MALHKNRSELVTVNHQLKSEKIDAKEEGQGNTNSSNEVLEKENNLTEYNYSIKVYS